MLPPFAAVYFDCDSTLSSIEGVDELLQNLAPELTAEIRLLTEQAMNGTAPLAAIYERRLARIAPSRAMLARVGELYIERAVADAGLVVQALQHLGKHVGVVSGGLLPPVRHLALHLGVPEANVHAVPIRFAADGSYRDFDRSSPLWQNGGKVTVLQALPAAHRPVAFVGDGATDLETQGTAARFVGFGGVVARDAVRRGAEFFAAGPGLASVLPFVLDAVERARLAGDPRFSSLVPSRAETRTDPA